ncbi:unnamed protein product [Camellia sinensis]
MPCLSLYAWLTTSSIVSAIRSDPPPLSTSSLSPNSLPSPPSSLPSSSSSVSSNPSSPVLLTTPEMSTTTASSSKKIAASFLAPPPPSPFFIAPSPSCAQTDGSTACESSNRWDRFAWLCDEFPRQALAGVNPVNIELFGDNASAAVPVDNLRNFPPVNTPVAAPVGHVSMSPLGVGAPVAVTANKSTTFSSGLPSNGANSFVKVADGGQWPNMLPHQPSLFPATGSQPTAQPFTPPVSGSSNNQPWNLSIASNPQGPSSIPSAQISQAFSKPAPDITSQSSSMEVKPSGRTELPESIRCNLSIFCTSSGLANWSTPGIWIQYAIYNTAMPMPTFPHASKSTNPFDLNNELSPVQAPMFPSMASNVAAPAGLLSTSSLGTPSTSWMLSQSSYPSAMPAQAPSLTYAVPPSGHMFVMMSQEFPILSKLDPAVYGSPESAITKDLIEQELNEMSVKENPEVQGVLTATQKHWPHIHIFDSLVMADSAVKMVKAGCQYITVLGVDFMSENVRAILDQAGFLEQGV